VADLERHGNSIKMCLNALRWKVVDWIHLAQDGNIFDESGNEHSGCMKCGDFFLTI
jgi:hypothetical protein